MFASSNTSYGTCKLIMANSHPTYHASGRKSPKIISRKAYGRKICSLIGFEKTKNLMRITLAFIQSQHKKKKKKKLD
jgi:hypothetical protein